MTELIGWCAAAILLSTLVRQVYTQWKSGTAEGVSKWLFIGQLSASVLFTVYSLLLSNWVFAVSNLMLIVVAVTGQFIYYRNKRRDARRGKGSSPDQTAAAAL